MDLVLYDIKHPDPLIHKGTVGVDNRLILENLRYLHDRVPLWLRVPLIPGFNDDDASLWGIATMARDLHLEKVCILPHHRWGSGKHDGLGRKYEFVGLEEIGTARLILVRELFASAGIASCEIME